MDAAKEAISKLTAGHGHHTTKVSEHYNPAVTHEHVARTREHEDTTVIDKETHQDHHHTTVIPVKDQEVLPTEHSHRLAAAQHSEHHHGDHKGIHDKVAAEAASFQNRREVAPVEQTRSEAPAVAGEHHHHHIHETIQPIIQKQTIQPSVVHTTIPVHEVHHNEPKHYSASALPAVSLEEFQKQGGSLTGLADRTERFEGEPENISRHGAHASQTGGTTSSGLANTSRSGLDGTTSSNLNNAGTTSSNLNNAGTTSSNLNNAGTSGLSSTRSGMQSTGTNIGNEASTTRQAVDPRVDGSTHNQTGTGTTSTRGLGSTGTTNTLRDSSNSNTSSTGRPEGKPSLLQKLNPFKDSDGDGKKGVMS